MKVKKTPDGKLVIDGKIRSRTPPVLIKQSILRSLARFPKTIYEISVDTGHNFKTIKRNILDLEKRRKVVKEYSEGLNKNLWRKIK